MILAPAWIDGRSRVVNGDDQLPADPGMAKISSPTDDDAARGSDIEGDDGDGRQERPCADVAHQHGVGRQALQAGGADISLFTRRSSRTDHARDCATKILAPSPPQDQMAYAVGQVSRTARRSQSPGSSLNWSATTIRTGSAVTNSGADAEIRNEEPETTSVGRLAAARAASMPSRNGDSPSITAIRHPPIRQRPAIAMNIVRPDCWSVRIEVPEITPAQQADSQWAVFAGHVRRSLRPSRMLTAASASGVAFSGQHGHRGHRRQQLGQPEQPLSTLTSSVIEDCHSRRSNQTIYHRSGHRSAAPSFHRASAFRSGRCAARMQVLSPAHRSACPPKRSKNIGMIDGVSALHHVLPAPCRISRCVLASSLSGGPAATSLSNSRLFHSAVSFPAAS